MNKLFFVVLLFSCNPSTKQLWEDCQYEDCEESLYCAYAEDVRLNNKGHYFCTAFCSKDNPCPEGPDKVETQCKILIKDEGLCLIPCSNEFESGCPGEMSCIDTEGFTKRYCW